MGMPGNLQVHRARGCRGPRLLRLVRQQDMEIAARSLLHHPRQVRGQAILALVIGQVTDTGHRQGTAVDRQLRRLVLQHAQAQLAEVRHPRGVVAVVLMVAWRQPHAMRRMQLGQRVDIDRIAGHLSVDHVAGQHDQVGFGRQHIGDDAPRAPSALHRAGVDVGQHRHPQPVQFRRQALHRQLALVHLRRFQAVEHAQRGQRQGQRHQGAIQANAMQPATQRLRPQQACRQPQCITQQHQQQHQQERQQHPAEQQLQPRRTGIVQHMHAPDHSLRRQQQAEQQRQAHMPAPRATAQAVHRPPQPERQQQGNQRYRHQCNQDHQVKPSG